jgi:hypothetical protein
MKPKDRPGKPRSCDDCRADLSAKPTEVKNPLTGAPMMGKRRPHAFEVSLSEHGKGSPVFVTLTVCPDCMAAHTNDSGLRLFAKLFQQLSLKR